MSVARNTRAFLVKEHWKASTRCQEGGRSCWRVQWAVRGRESEETWKSYCKQMVENWIRGNGVLQSGGATKCQSNLWLIIAWVVEAKVGEGQLGCWWANVPECWSKVKAASC